MTAAKLAAKYNLNVMRISRPSKKGRDMSYYTAFRGGNGTGEPVVNVANAFTLAALDRRLAKQLSTK